MLFYNVIHVALSVELSSVASREAMDGAKVAFSASSHSSFRHCAPNQIRNILQATYPRLLRICGPYYSEVYADVCLAESSAYHDYNSALSTLRVLTFLPRLKACFAARSVLSVYRRARISAVSRVFRPKRVAKRSAGLNTRFDFIILRSN